MNQSQRSLARVVQGHTPPSRAPVMWWTWQHVLRTLRQHDDWMPVTALQALHEPRCNPGTLRSLIREATRHGLLQARYRPGEGARRVLAVRLVGDTL